MERSLHLDLFWGWRNVKWTLKTSVLPASLLRWWTIRMQLDVVYWDQIVLWCGIWWMWAWTHSILGGKGINFEKWRLLSVNIWASGPHKTSLTYLVARTCTPRWRCWAWTRLSRRSWTSPTRSQETASFISPPSAERSRRNIGRRTRLSSDKICSKWAADTVGL